MSVNRIWKGELCRKGLQWATGALGLLPIGLAVFSVPVFAQIVPDNTLGSESSQVTPNVNIRGLPAERIDGGAVRGSALFHSFSEFNVNNGQRVYFSNPAGIADIFSRVTGSNVSNILGTLGVDGGANLFVLNPNGILFGANAQLDIQGSFLATTGSSFKFSDGSEFSATNPQAAPLLSINVTPGVQWGANQPGATITNRGNLKAGQDLTLAALNLDLQGQLQAGRNLTLQAQDTVKVRDTVTTPFLAQSGDNLTVQGNQGIDILALNHPTQIPFVSGGNLSLISDGIISGDARFSSGGGFSIKSVSGGLANFLSYYDPIISANGDVGVAADYEGTSLLVEATGNIRFGGNITITGPDTSTLPAGLDTATLSSGSALIMRSGQSTLAYGGVNSGGVPNYGTGNVRAGITLSGDVILQPFNGTGGTVTLLAASGDVSTKLISTNGQQVPDFMTGNTNGGNISLTATNGSITTGNLFSYSYPGNSVDGGAITLTAGRDIKTGKLNSQSFNRNGGAIALKAGGDISTVELNSSSSAGNGGAITLKAGGNISLAEYINSSSFRGNGGAITLKADNNISIISITGSLSSNSWYGNGETIALDAGRDINTGKLDSYSSGGNGGVITLRAGRDISTRSLSSFAWNGNGGAIDLRAGRDISTDFLHSYSYSNQAGKDSQAAGAITVSATNGNISLKGNLYSFSYSKFGNSGAGGVISLSAREGKIEEISNLNSFSVSEQGTAGNGGNVNIEARNTLSNLDILTLSSYEKAKAGNVEVKGFGDLELTDTNIVTSGQLTLVLNSMEKITLDLNKIGRSGDVAITSLGNLTFNNSRIESDTKGSASAGNITITSPGLVTFNNSQIISNTSSTGQAGSISVFAPEIRLNSASALSAKTSSSGRAGDVNLQAYAGGQTLSVFFQGGAEISASSTSTSTGQGGNIRVTAPQSVTLSGNGKLSSETSGSGQAGSVNITTPTLNVNGGAKVSTTTTESATGTGGDITVRANTLNMTGAESGLFAETKGAANAGNLTLNPYIGGSDLQVNFTGGAKASASTSGNGQGGSFDVIAPNSVTLSGNGQLSAETTASGQAGSVNITTPTLNVNGGAKVSTTTTESATGTGGDITVRANTLNMTGAKSGLFAETQGAANAGNLTLNPQSGANDLQVNFAEGAKVSASTSRSGTGGSLNVTAPNSVTLRGNGQLSAETSGSGRAGNVEITTPTLNVNGGAKVSTTTTSTVNTGTGGNLTVSANTLNMTGAKSGLLAETQGAANAGSLTLNSYSSNNLQVNFTEDAQISASTSGSGTGGNLTVKAPNSVTLSGDGQLAVESTGTGAGGNIFINTSELTVQNNAKISASGSGTGQGGNINVQAGTLKLDQGSIVSQTAQSQAGDITLTLNDLLLLRHNSLISTTAGSAQAPGNGGNITIRAPFVVAVPYENSDIIANAFSGDGGQINIIDNYRVFGLKPQNRQSFNTLRQNRTSDISASSQSGNQGNINIQSLSVDPSQGLTQLPVEVIDSSQQIANRCGAGNSTSANGQGEFVVTGRGGLPPSPDDMQSSGAITPGWVTRDGGNISRSAAPIEPPATPSTPPLVEAQGMFINAQGEVVLTAQTPTTTPHQPGISEPLCSPGTNGNE